MQIRSSKIKQLSVSKWSKFEHWFSYAVSAILDAENLWTDVKRRDNECTCVISFREENFELFGQNFSQRRKLFSDFSVFKWLGPTDCDIGSALTKWTVNFVGDTIILVSGHKVLTFGSCFEYESGWQGTFFTMIPCRLKFCRNPSCGFWHPVVCLNYKSETGCVYGDKCRFRHVEEYVKPNNTVKERCCERISCYIEGVYTICVVYLKLFIRENLFNVNLECWDQNTPSNSPKAQRHLAPNQNSGKKGSIARYYPIVCTSSAWSLRAANRGQISWGYLDPRTMRPQSSVGFDEKHVQAQEFGQSYGPMFLVKSKVCRHLSLQRDQKCDNSKSIQEHRCTWWAKKDFSSEELWTVIKVQNPNSSVDCKRRCVHCTREEQVFVHELNQFVTVQLLEETPAVLSPGKLCKDHGFSYEWVSDQKPRLTKNGKIIICKTHNFVPLVVPGLSVNSGSSASSTTPPQESLGPGAISSIWKHSGSKLIFRFSIWSELTN